MSTVTPVYTAPPKPETMRSRAGRGKWWLVGLGLILILAASVAITARPSDYTALSIENNTDTGARAVAQILRGQGVEVTQFDTLARVAIADPSTTTLVIASADNLTRAHRSRPCSSTRATCCSLVPPMNSSPPSIPGWPSPTTSCRRRLTPQCSDPDATAAQRMRVEFTGLQRVDDSDAQLCFANRSDVFGMAVVATDNGTRTIVTNPAVYQNSALLTDGNAALALRTAGHHENLAWYVSSYYDGTLLSDSGGSSDLEINADFMPPGFGTALYALGLAALVGALWKGRRFGPLAVEPLPVVVRASEATRGRARLYRRGRSYGRATAAMRAASARRIGSRLGVPRTTDREGMVAAVQRATGMTGQEIARILYGPPPTSEAEMINVVDQLDELEGKVH